MHRHPQRRSRTRPIGAAVAGLILAFGLTAFLPATTAAKDYVIRFVKETYKADAEAGNPDGRVYHTWAVETDFGKKLLVLRGDDPVLRGWLREFAKSHELFLAKVPEAETGAFELNTVVPIDVAHLHPIDPEFVEDAGKKKGRRRK